MPLLKPFFLPHTLHRWLLAAGTACWIGLSAPPAAAIEPFFPPRDELATDASWQRFRQRLLTAIEARDIKFVMSIVARDVRNGLERDKGHTEFKLQWLVDEPDSPLWRELRRALHLGASYFQHEHMPRSACAPYVLPHWPQDLDPTEHGAIISQETQMREAPSGRSAILETLSYSVVPVNDWEVADLDRGNPQRWVRVNARQRQGFIPEEHIRSPLEHLACFRKGAQGWQLTSFMAAGE